MIRPVVGTGRLATAHGIVLAMAAAPRAQARDGPTAASHGRWHFGVTPNM